MLVPDILPPLKESISDVFFKVGFYKSFGRPIAKVFLGAVFTYQFTYLAWMRLEKDEIKQQKRGMFIRGP